MECRRRQTSRRGIESPGRTAPHRRCVTRAYLVRHPPRRCPPRISGVFLDLRWAQHACARTTQRSPDVPVHRAQAHTAAHMQDAHIRLLPHRTAASAARAAEPTARSTTRIINEAGRPRHELSGCTDSCTKFTVFSIINDVCLNPTGLDNEEDTGSKQAQGDALQPPSMSPGPSHGGSCAGARAPRQPHPVLREARRRGDRAVRYAPHTSTALSMRSAPPATLLALRRARVASWCRRVRQQGQTHAARRENRSLGVACHASADVTAQIVGR